MKTESLNSRLILRPSESLAKRLARVAKIRGISLSAFAREGIEVFLRERHADSGVPQSIKTNN